MSEEERKAYLEERARKEAEARAAAEAKARAEETKSETVGVPSRRNVRRFWFVCVHTSEHLRAVIRCFRVQHPRSVQVVHCLFRLDTGSEGRQLAGKERLPLAIVLRCSGGSCWSWVSRT